MKPRIEDYIEEILALEEKENALQFIEFLKSIKLVPTYASKNAWKVNKKGQGILYIRLFGTAPYHRLEEGSWHINFLDFHKLPLIDLTDNTKALVLDNIKKCFACSNCKPGFDIKILDNNYNNICHNWFVVTNPSKETLANMQDFILTITN